jgi:hypothetical protein
MVAPQWSATTELVANVAVAAIVLYAIKKVFVDNAGNLVGKDKDGDKVKIAKPVKTGGWQLINPKSGKASGEVYKTKEAARKAYNKKYAGKKVKSKRRLFAFNAR